MKHTETSMVEGETAEIGRDPRKMTEDELNELGHSKRPLLAVIRQNCIECCVGAIAEVRRCRMIACPMWPYRMGSNPFHHTSLTEIQRAEASERLRVSRESKNTSAVKEKSVPDAPATFLDGAAVGEWLRTRET